MTPQADRRDDLLEFLKRCDKVIGTLLQKLLPGLTHRWAFWWQICKNSVRICSELAPNQYFELINQIW